jgi:hypothetical protein
VLIRIARYRGSREDKCQRGIARSEVVYEADQRIISLGILVRYPRDGLAAIMLQWVESLWILQQVEAELNSMRLIPRVFLAVIPDYSRQIKVTRLQDPIDEIFEMPEVEFMLARTALASSTRRPACCR